MLGDEHRVAAVWRLPAVVARLGGSESLLDQLVRVPAHRCNASEIHDGQLPAAESELGSERVPADAVQAGIQIVHQRVNP